MSIRLTQDHYHLACEIASRTATVMRSQKKSAKTVTGLWMPESIKHMIYPVGFLNLIPIPQTPTSVEIHQTPSTKMHTGVLE